jgi:UDP-glucose 4-epimerase
MNILLTGGTGYIGSHTAVVLVQAGHRVVLYDNLSNSRATVVGHLAAITGQTLPFIQGDVRDTDLLQHTLQVHHIDAVIHFAGLKAVGESVEKPIDYYSNNVGGTISVLAACKTAGVKRLVFSSSATVYGVPHYLPLDEAHPLSATNPYGRSKLQVEEILSDVAQSDPAWRVTCLRYFNPVGAHDSGLIGEDPHGIPNNLMPYIARVAAKTLPQLQVFGDDYDTPDGTGVRDYIHVMDLAEGHLAALQQLQTRAQAFDVINLGTGHGHSVLEMANAFAKASGRAIPYRIAPRRAGDIATCYANADKARTVLNWTATRSLHDMCASTWRSRLAADAGRDACAPRHRHRQEMTP